jgi:hypothetical protein
MGSAGFLALSGDFEPWALVVHEAAQPDSSLKRRKTSEPLHTLYITTTADLPWEWLTLTALPRPSAR